jgi:hypothetical protein
MEQGRYDLVPINLTNAEYMDFQIEGPNMYQSAQCRGQFVYSRFRNIGDTFDMYANKVENNKPIFDPNAPFTDSEVVYDGVTTGDEAVEEYCSLTGSSISSLGDGAKYILYRLPKIWNKPDTPVIRNLNNKRTLLRLSNLGTTDDEIKSVKKLKERFASQIDKSVYTIVPKIQAAYGYTDLGTIHSGDLTFDTDENGTSFVTTHKIGYEEKARYATGENTCNSYLFLSPVNHSEIQVDGDTIESSKKLKSGESLRVPIIYQYRMTDSTGKIFGKYNQNTNASRSIIKNTKFANIIGIDIWTNRNSLKPKQYDIVVYSTYSTTIDTNTNRTKTSSTQSLVNIGNEIVKKFEVLRSDSKKIPINKDLNELI